MGDYFKMDEKNGDLHLIWRHMGVRIRINMGVRIWDN